MPHRENLYKSGPLKVPQYEVKQSPFDWTPKLPFRLCLTSPSGGGKTTILVNLLMQVYQKNGRSCFDAIYLVSHSVNLDASFTPVKKMIDEMETGGYYDHFDEAVIRKLFDEHVAHVAYQKKHGHNKNSPNHFLLR